MSKELIKKYQTKNTSNQFCFDAFDIVVLLFKQQNEKLINLIGKYKNLDDDELEDFRDDFLKIGFYMPNITKNKYEEDMQIHFINKRIEKLKNIKKNEL